MLIKQKSRFSISIFAKKYYLTIILLVVLTATIWQPLIINNIPERIIELQNNITKQQLVNAKQTLTNQQLLLKINALTNVDSQILESEARYRLGLIKNGEKYYKIK